MMMAWKYDTLSRNGDTVTIAEGDRMG